MLRILSILVLGFILACRSERPEDAVRKAFEACVTAVEKGEVEPVSTRMHPRFSGPEGMDRAQGRLFLASILRRQKVGVTILSQALQMKGKVAFMQVELLLTGREGSGLLPNEASRRSFALRWELHEGDWKLQELKETSA